VIVAKKQFEPKIYFIEMGSQEYLFRYACPPYFLSAILFIRRLCGGLEGLPAVRLASLNPNSCITLGG